MTYKEGNKSCSTVQNKELTLVIKPTSAEVAVKERSRGGASFPTEDRADMTDKFKVWN